MFDGFWSRFPRDRNRCDRMPGHGVAQVHLSDPRSAVPQFAGTGHATAPLRACHSGESGLRFIASLCVWPSHLIGWLPKIVRI